MPNQAKISDNRKYAKPLTLDEFKQWHKDICIEIKKPLSTKKNLAFEIALEHINKKIISGMGIPKEYFREYYDSSS